MKKTTPTSVVPDKGASTRLLALLEEAHGICQDHNWPYLFAAVAAAPDEIASHISGKVDMRDEGVRALLVSASEDGFRLAAAAKAHAEAAAEYRTTTEPA